MQLTQNIIDITKIFGNHLVTLVDIPDENITLVVDSTNPNLGIFRNGYIYMFSRTDGKLLKVKISGQTLYGSELFKNTKQDILMSFFDNQIDINTLRQKYGTIAQNEALDYVRKINQEKLPYTDNTYELDQKTNKR